MSIQKIKDGVYRVFIDKTINGKRHRPSKKIETKLKGKKLVALQTKIEEELELQLKEKLNDKEDLMEFTMRDLLNWYIERKPLEQRTIEYYEVYMENRTIDWFENKKAYEVTYDEAEEFMYYLDKEVSPATKRSLSQKTKKHYLIVLRTLFKEYSTCLSRRNIRSINPFEGLSVKCPQRSLTGKFYTPKEIQSQIKKLLEIGDVELTAMFVLTLLGGLRPAELSGLTWEKINFEKKVMLIDTNLTPTKRKGNIRKTTKNCESRTISLIPLAIDLLLMHKQDEQEKYSKLNIEKSFQSMFVFTSPSGKEIYHGQFRRRWRTFCGQNGFDYKPPYSLRHTAATILALNNIPKINISRQLGHLDPQTTDIYIHAIDSVRNDIANIFEDTLSTIR